ncbi:hypothetical protein ACUOA8_53910, partial [Escherichia sp. SS-MK2]
MGTMGILATCLCLYCFFSVRERIYHPKPSLGMAAQFRLLIKNDQWLILGAVIAIIMFGGIIRTWWGIVICFSLVISGPRWMTLTF